MSDRRLCKDFFREYGRAVYYKELDKIGRRCHPVYGKLERFVNECLLSFKEIYEEWVQRERVAESLATDEDEDYEFTGREEDNQEYTLEQIFGTESDWECDEEEQKEAEKSVGEKREREDDHVSDTDAKRSRESECLFTDQMFEFLLKTFCESLENS